MKLQSIIWSWSSWPWCLTSLRQRAETHGKFPLNKWSGYVLSVHRKLKRFHDPGPKQTYWKGTVKGHKFTDISRWRGWSSHQCLSVVSCRSEVFWRSLQNAQQSWLRQLESHQLSNCCPLPLWQKILVGFPLQRALLCLLTFSSFSNVKHFTSTLPSGTTLQRNETCTKWIFYIPKTDTQYFTRTKFSIIDSKLF